MIMPEYGAVWAVSRQNGLTQTSLGSAGVVGEYRREALVTESDEVCYVTRQNGFSKIPFDVNNG